MARRLARTLAGRPEFRRTSAALETWPPTTSAAGAAFGSSSSSGGGRGGGVGSTNAEAIAFATEVARDLVAVHGGRAAPNYAGVFRARG